jgi:adenylate cyclase
LKSRYSTTPLLQHSIERALLLTALAPIVPHLLGGIFNIWYNMVIIDPLLRAAGLRDRFIHTAIVWNVLVFSGTISAWVHLVLSLRPAYRRLRLDEPMPEAQLDAARRRLVNMPWYSAVIGGTGWLMCIPVFLVSLSLGSHGLNAQLYWHLPISFVVSGFIAITQSFFLVEWITHWGLFPAFFRNARADRLKGIYPISLRTRGLMWAISASICPIGSLLLLAFAPISPGTHPEWFALFVGTVGIAFGLCSALLIGRSVAHPVDQLRLAAQSITQGKLDVEVPLRRADEFGALISEFNRMIAGLREKERLRQTFGLHVGEQAAKHILAHDPGLGGTEQVVTVMFVDIRSFTARSAQLAPDQAVQLLNEFLRAMVQVVEQEHHGMINKFLGDGFMALFGIGDDAEHHADAAVAAARGMERKLEQLNHERVQRGGESIEFGIGINTGPAIVGSIGSPDRMEFTVIGNTVNIASRIETLNKTMGTTLLMSKTTRDALKRPINLRSLPPQLVRGATEPIEIFTVAT